MTAAGERLAVGLVQMAMSESAADNDRTAEQGIREAAKQGAKLVCLPELYRSRYFCQSENEAFFKLAEPVPVRIDEGGLTWMAEE